MEKCACVEWHAFKYQSTRLLDEWPIHAVHLVVETAGIAQVMAGAVATPQRRVDRTAIYALAPFGEVLGRPLVNCIKTEWSSNNTLL